MFPLQSARSGSLLLTAANLAQISRDQSTTTDPLSNKDQNIKYYLERTDPDVLLSLPNGDLKKNDPDNVSIASSMHFTVVNVNTRPPVKPRSFCRKHQLTILVVTMSALFTLGIVCAIVFLESEYKIKRTYTGANGAQKAVVSREYSNFYRIFITLFDCRKVC